MIERGFEKEAGAGGKHVVLAVDDDLERPLDDVTDFLSVVLKESLKGLFGASMVTEACSRRSGA